jgi:large subunit ribosomal protein L18
MKTKVKKIKRERRKKKIRAKVFGTSSRPRLSIFKSNRYITLQIINDEKGSTLAHSSTKLIKAKTLGDRAYEAGKDIAVKAKNKSVSKVVFDRGGYVYTGSVARAALGAREGGLEF